MVNTMPQTGKTNLERLFHYWGKAGEEDKDYHLLVYHCLDVAACGVMLLRLILQWRSLLEKITGLSGKALEDRIFFYLALHDLGKFATGFQNLRPDLLRRMQQRESDKGYIERHDTLGWLLWRHRMRQRFCPSRRRRSRGSPCSEIDSWMQAVAGHHGEPPGEPQRVLEDAFDTADFDAAETFVQTLQSLAGLEAFPRPDKEQSKAASWWIAGLTVLADWLGSNRKFFPYCNKRVSLDAYWQEALTNAEKVVCAAGLVSQSATSQFILADCFAEPPVALNPTPLQTWAQDVAITPGPALFILEDVTGAGKTEAALLLAWRLLRANDGTGVYFGLPTMATANSMYQRLGGGDPPVYARLFEGGRPPSLTLAHGRADLVAAFRESLLPMDTDERDYGDGTLPVGARCNAWLADNRKKALLAEVGVGTIDQALLAILASRHQSLRLLGLLGKVLIVDEVHACDAYMNRLLERLLQAHARAGGSTILLSATLPHDQKQRLATAFGRGSGFDPPAMEPTDHYPLATWFMDDHIQQQPLDTRPDVARRVEVCCAEQEQDIEAWLQQVVESGRCACWICNTVDDARRRYEQLRTTHPDGSIELFHARFTLHDRLRIEQRVLGRFGKDSGPEQRQGRILIATQVVEQSLDLDFDVLVSDLAPIDLLIQRAGRLCRHSRDASGQRIDGPDQRSPPVLTLLAPPWTDEPKTRWLRDHLPGTAAVYRDEDGRLWLAMKLLREKGGFEMPADARHLVEGIYGADPFTDIPEGLQQKALDAEGEAKAQRSIAKLKVLDIKDGYRREGPWLDEDIAPTRLGEPTTTLWLAHWEDGRLLPLHSDDPRDDRAWHLSSLTVRQSLVAAEIPPEGIDAETWAQHKAVLPGKGRWGVVVTLEQDEDHLLGRALGPENERRLLRYSGQSGLQIDYHQGSKGA